MADLGQDRAAACEHDWHFVKQETDSKLVVTDLRRRGFFKALRLRLFGPLTPDKLGWSQTLSRSSWWIKGTCRQWACAKCRLVEWDYVESGNPEPEVVT